jgi:choline dehydrogenase-like flavoprotein
MLIDFADDGSPRHFAADICIVGAGAAGLSLAMSFAKTRLSVCLAESGGLRYEPDTQALYEGPTAGLPWFCQLHDCRLRRFGGTTSGDWGGGCTPLNDLDFATRPWVPFGEWPIGKDQLRPYYERAREAFALSSAPFEDPGLLARVLAQLDSNPVAFDPAVLVSRYYLKSDVHFGVNQQSLHRAPNITLLLHANAVNLQTSENAETVERLDIRALSGRSGTIQARAYILACGGIESARLLLASNTVEPHGVGNRHDLVGRFFMDHPSGTVGTVVTNQPERLIAMYDHSYHWDRRLPVYPTLCLSDKAQESSQLLNARCRLVTREDGPIADGVVALRRLLDHLRRRRIGADVFRQLRRIGADLGHVATATKRRFNGQNITAIRLDLDGVFEQAPNPDSRITLSDEFDALGQRRAKLDWRFTELDWRTIRNLASLFDAQLRQLGIGYLETAEWLLSGQPELNSQVRGVAHHLGTTRMADDPRCGVVDRNCRVHGIDNLFINSGSVMPTGGFAGPTFTIVALGIRLTDHLKDYLARMRLSEMAASDSRFLRFQAGSAV